METVSEKADAHRSEATALMNGPVEGAIRYLDAMVWPDLDLYVNLPQGGGLNEYEPVASGAASLRRRTGSLGRSIVR